MVLIIWFALLLGLQYIHMVSLLSLFNLYLSILKFLVCCFVSSLIFLTPYFPFLLLYQSGQKYFYCPIFCLCQKYKVIIELFYLHYYFHIFLLQKLQPYSKIQLRYQPIYTCTQKSKNFWWCQCLITFHCFSLNILFGARISFNQLKSLVTNSSLFLNSH